jgi:hypothetical protein
LSLSILFALAEYRAHAWRSDVEFWKHQNARNEALVRECIDGWNGHMERMHDAEEDEPVVSPAPSQLRMWPETSP